MKRKILVTSALPYANGDIHLGHMIEHIQTDIWVRFQKMRGHECYYVCADDTHGTPVMLAAEKQGKKPEELIAEMNAQHQQDFAGFLIHYDNYYTTHSPENKQFSNKIFNCLQANNKITKKTIKQLFDPEKKMFLPDRFVKGECPKCHAQDQYGDNCEVCGGTYSSGELINPYSTVSGVAPILKATEHFFFKLSECEGFLKDWIQGEDTLADGTIRAHLQKQALNKIKEWSDGDLQDWDITRDAPYFGFEIPNAPGKYFYVWLDAPIGYMASFLNLCERISIDFDEYFKVDSTTELYHFIGKDILYFHALFWPAVLKYSTYRQPTAVYAHGFLTVDGQKMSKSRGTFITARSYLDEGLNPEWMRYYIATKLNSRIEDIDLNLQDFIARVNSDLVGKYINIAARASGFIQRIFNGCILEVGSSELVQALQQESEMIAQHYENREYAIVVKKIMALADQVNAYVDQNKPWELAKIKEQAVRLHQICSELIYAFKILTIYLAPILPQIAQKVRQFLNLDSLDWGDIYQPSEHLRINAYQHMVYRVEPKQVAHLIERNKKSMQNNINLAEITNHNNHFKPECSFSDFAKVDMRVAKVLACEKVEGSHKLLKFQLDLGGGVKKIIFSGIATSYQDPDELVGRMVIAVVNFKPRKIAEFGMSEGMILSAAGDNQLFLLDVDSGAKPGMSVG
ncbi:MAG: methionine--tRNA ligase [Neisseriaceae bacterium]|nr:MAG: methionine--tRNA ligase [Neisseriaceae bacterium]